MFRSSMRTQSARAATLAAPVLPAAVLSAVFGLGVVFALASLTSPASAYDDDVDVVCYDVNIGGKSETECQTVEDLAAECALVDPEYTSDECGGLLENRVPVGVGLKTKDKPRRDDNGGKRDREPNGGGNSASGSAGGDPNSGGGSSSGTPNG